jgi:adenosylmethionine-8-amino-7-oxononanoate aminotransferase
LKYPDCGIRCAYFLEQTIENEGEDSIACMIAEPIQGYGGVIWPPSEYWSIVRNICKEHNIFLIADEIQNGFCRTGKFWGVDNWGIVPDIMTLGKGINCAYLPLAATAVSAKVYDGLRGHIFLGGGTASGNAIVVATARAALRIYLTEKMDDRSNKLGEHIHERLVGEFLPLPCVEDIMGKGCYQSFEIAPNKTTGHKVSQEARDQIAATIMSQLLENGVIPPVVRARRVTITPAFIITEEELDRALDTLLRVMKNVRPV